MKRTVLITLLAMALLISGCGESYPAGTAENDIITFENNEANKPIIRVGIQYYTPNDSIVTTLSKKFPDYLFVKDISASAGSDSENVILEEVKRGDSYDLMIAGSISYLFEENVEDYEDLSAEAFLDQYLLSVLNQSSVDGRVYAIPGTSTLSGIAFNMDMFEEHGWEVPNNTDEFFALCEEIKEAGIKPFSTCFKYDGQVNRLLGMMCYSELYRSPEDLQWMADIRENKATYRGHMEPFYELAERFYAEEVISIDDFSASLTKQRQAFWDGEYAMIDYDSNIYTYMEDEHASFEVGMMPYPAKDGVNSCYMMNPQYYFAIPKQKQADPERLAVLKEILAYISSGEGQEALLAGSLRFSNVKGMEPDFDNPSAEYVKTAYERGNLFPVITYGNTGVDMYGLQQASIQKIFEGASVEEALKAMDDSMQESYAQGPTEEEYEVLTTADKDFTMLETSYYIADQMKKATGADIALMPNGTYFKGNLAKFHQGEITSNLKRFVMKAMTDEDCLTTYSVTGAQLKGLMEHPIINGEEANALVAASGLKIEYAPWNERGARVLKLTLEDGSEIEDDAVYTAAAYKGVFAEDAMTAEIKSYEELGTIQDLMYAALSQEKSISPDIKDRVKLVWPKIKK